MVSYFAPPPPPPPQPPVRPTRRRRARNPTRSSAVSNAVDEQDESDHPEDEEDEEGTSVEPGMLLETKDLYRSDPREDWDVWAPEDIGIDGEKDGASGKFALVVKREKTQEDDGSSGLQLHSIQVQSPLIKTLLGPVFANYPGIKTSLKKLKFHAPFHEFFYRWQEFLQALKDSQHDETQAAHFKLLFDIVSTEIKPHIEEVKDLLLNDVITYRSLWALFEPGMEIYSLVDGQHRLYRLTSSEYVKTFTGQEYFQLSCKFVDTDGVNFGFNSTTLTISKFADVVPIVDLAALPAHIKPEIESIRTQLGQRGKKFESLNGCHYKAYAGDYILANPTWGRSPKATVGLRLYSSVFMC